MFTPAQTLVTSRVVAAIGEDPIEAISAHVFHLNHDNEPARGCEQVTVDHFTNTVEAGIVYQTCSSTEATWIVTWTDDMGNDEMAMCTFHKEEFEKDAETDDHITGYSIEEL